MQIHIHIVAVWAYIYNRMIRFSKNIHRSSYKYRGDFLHLLVVEFIGKFEMFTPIS